MRRLEKGLVLALLAGAGWAWAQEETPAPQSVDLPELSAVQVPQPGAPVTQEQVEALKQAIEALSQQVKVLERQIELDKEAAAEKAKTTPVVSAGKDGFGIASPDKAFTLKVGGLFAYDLSWFNQDRELKNSVGDEQDGTGFNYARIRLSGTVYDVIDYVAEYDFATQTGPTVPSSRTSIWRSRESPTVATGRWSSARATSVNPSAWKSSPASATARSRNARWPTPSCPAVTPVFS